MTTLKVKPCTMKSLYDTSTLLTPSSAGFATGSRRAPNSLARASLCPKLLALLGWAIASTSDVGHRTSSGQLRR